MVYTGIVKKIILPPGSYEWERSYCVSLGLRRCVIGRLDFFKELKMRKILRYFTPFEWSLWSVSVFAIALGFFLGEEKHLLSFCSSLVGVTALIFLAKGNPIGQLFTGAFASLYAAVSFEQRYYGEMITYLGMSLPSALVGFFHWLKHPSKKGASEVEVSAMTAKKWAWLCVTAVLVTAAFYFILDYFNTNNLLVSTLSVTTSFFAAMLMIFRSPYYAVAYAANDIVLIILWVSACFVSLAYLPTVLCFVAFLLNDLYAFFNWKRMEKRQKTD